ncbi:glycosyltransferase family 9 protein [Chloroherpeton thalassium]|nr:glycosyltransferase family 9 protein [Chloroherpeton thalassium]
MQLQKFYAIYGQGLWKTKFKRKRISAEKSFLIVQLASLGDACTLVPTIKKLAENNLPIDIICSAGLEPLWSAFFPSAQVVGFASKKWSGAYVQSLVRKSLRSSYEAVFVTSIHPYAGFVASQVRAASRYGMIEGNRFYKGARVFYDKVYRAAPNEHVSKRFNGLFSLYEPFAKQFEAAAVQSLSPQKIKDRKYVLVHPGAKWPPRRWPKEFYGELLRRLANDGVFCKVLVNQAETDLYEFFKSQVQPGKIEMAHTRDLMDLMAAVAGCTVFLGNDSGPSHLANLYGKPIIVLWGPGNYERIRPLGENVSIIIKEIECRPCRQYVREKFCERGENVCLRSISVEEVHRAVREKLQTVRPAS